MPLNINTPSVIAAESLAILQNELIIGSLLYRDRTADFTQKSSGWAVGDTIDVKTPTEFQVDDFTTTINKQSIRDSKTSFQIERHLDISSDITSKQRKLQLSDLSREVIQPAMAAMAQEVDLHLGTKMTQGRGLYSSADLFGTPADVALARKAATEGKISKNNRLAFLDLDLEAKLLGATWFNQSQTRGADGELALRNGEMGRAMGMSFFSSINLPTDVQSVGNGAGVTVNAGNQNDLIGLSALPTTATTGTFNAGDVIQIAGVQYKFIVASQVLAGATSIPLVDPIDTLIPDAAAITAVPSAANAAFQGVICNPNSYAWAAPPLDNPGDKVSAAVATVNGMSVRFVEGYDQITKEFIWSWDMLIGARLWDRRGSLTLRQQ